MLTGFETWIRAAIRADRPRPVALALDRIELEPSGGASQDATRQLFEFCRSVRQGFREQIAERELPHRSALFGRIRGNGPGCSFGESMRAMEAMHPLPLRSPFEGEALVAGAVWEANALIGPGSNDAILKLRFEPGAVTLPMHSHEASDRFIVVLEGRGFFHVTDESVETFSGRSIRTTAVRKGDALVFAGGVVHTFSSPAQALTLLSYHAPYVPLEDPRQYTLPEARWTGAELLERQGEFRAGTDPAWSVLAAAP